MAGLFGLGGYDKPGKGVKKDEREKKRFFAFFDLFKRKFGKLVKLNLLFLLFCLPIVTIGPAIAALFKITRYYVEEKPVFLFSDFFDAFKQNFKQGFIVGLINALLMFFCNYGMQFYISMAETNGLYWIVVVLLCMFMLATFVAFMYIYLMMVTVDLPIFALLRNSYMMIFLGRFTNFFTLFFVALLIAVEYLLFPWALILAPFLLFSLIALIISFNSFQYIYKYLIKPYYDKSGEENPYERTYDDELIASEEN